MKKTIVCVIVTTFILCLLFPIFSKAIAVPTGEMAKEVIDYYYYGQEQGPILTEARLCKTVQELECAEEIDPNFVPLGETVRVWMRFLVPRDAMYDDILVEYKYKGMPWRIMPRKVEGSIRYRVVDAFRLDKAGEWTITIKRGANKLKEFTLNVVEN